MSRTVPTLPNNSLTPSFSTVSSTAGFQAGDLVYLKDNAFNPIPDNAVGSASFNIPASVALGEAPTSSIIQSLVARDGGSWKKANKIARLTNGNIVVVYVDTATTRPFFRIINEDFVEQVAQTQVNTNSVNVGNVGVAALSGGGFVVAFTQGSTNLTYGVYNNSGVLQGSIVQDTTVAGFGNFDIKPLPLSGGFAVCYNNSSLDYRIRYYNSAGTAISSWVGLSPNANNSSYWPIICVRSDDTSVVIGAYFDGASTYQIRGWLITAAGASAGTTSAIGLSTTAIQNSGYHATVLSDNTIRLIYVDSTPAYRILDVANTWSGAVSLSWGTNVAGIWSATLSGDRVLFVGTFAGNTPATYYQILNSAGTTLLARQTYNGIVVGQAVDQGHVSVVETANYITLAIPTVNQPPSNGGYMPAFQMGATAPYDRRVLTSTSVIAGTATASVSGYARGNSTPNAAAFFAASSGTISTSSTAISGTNYVLSPRFVDTTACWGLDGAVLPNGNFVIAYLYSNLSAVKFNVYSALGVLQNIYTVPVTPFGPLVRVCVLTSGRIVVTCATASSTLTHYIYSSAFVLETTCTTTSVYLTNTISPGYGFSTAGLSDGRFMVGYRNASGFATYQVFESTGASVGTQTFSSGTGVEGVTISATLNGGAMAYYSDSTSLFSSYIYRTAAGGYNQSTYNITSSLTSAQNLAGKTIVSPSGTFVSFVNDSVTTRRVYFTDMGGTVSKAPTTFSVAGSSAEPSTAATALSTGEIVLFNAGNVSATGTLQVYAPGAFTPGGGVTPIVNNTMTLPVTANAQSGLGAQTTVIGLYGSRCVIAFLANSTLLPYFGIVDTASSTYSTNLTAGVSQSNASLSISPSNGYYLAGISASACTAGGVGAIQTNGVAVLNSNYPSTTTSQAFDFTSQSVRSGVRGTVSGRNVIIEG